MCFPCDRGKKSVNVCVNLRVCASVYIHVKLLHVRRFFFQKYNETRVRNVVIYTLLIQNADI